MPLPTPGKTHYDYAACATYLQAQYGHDERDLAGTYHGHPDAPYQNFWHFVRTRVPEMVNHGTFTMRDAWRRGAAPWEQDMLETYLSTFGETDPQTGERVIDFYVWW
jgi:hypothetical protein